jgi:uncharacterized protein YjiS (DUF1127 family)
MTSPYHRAHQQMRSEQTLLRLINEADSWAQRDEYEAELQALQQHQFDAGEDRAERLADQHY